MGIHSPGKANRWFAPKRCSMNPSQPEQDLSPMSVNQPPGFVKRQERAADAFLGGKLAIRQPEKGFRAGLDSVLLGASVPQGARQLLELGAGAGVATLVALAHDSDLSATLVENNP